MSIANETQAASAAQDERQDAAVAQVLTLARGVEPHERREADVVGVHGHLARFAVLDPVDRELLAAGEAERLRLSPARNWSGRMPIISRLERWIRS